MFGLLRVQFRPPENAPTKSGTIMLKSHIVSLLRVLKSHMFQEMRHQIKKIHKSVIATSYSSSYGDYTVFFLCPLYNTRCERHGIAYSLSRPVATGVTIFASHPLFALPMVSAGVLSQLRNACSAVFSTFSCRRWRWCSER